MANTPSMRQNIDNVPKTFGNREFEAAREIIAEANRIFKGRKGQWFCEASCNHQGYDGHVPSSDRVVGIGYGRTQDEACRKAKRDATQKDDNSAYARHCQCRCRKL